MKRDRARYRYRECGISNLYLENCEVFLCPKDGCTLPILPQTSVLNEAITALLVVSRQRLGGDEILFLRKALRMTSADLAAVLGVTRVTISRWENRHERIDKLADLRLRHEAIAQLLPIEKQAEVKARVTDVVLWHEDDKETTDSPELYVPLPWLIDRFAQELRNSRF